MNADQSEAVSNGISGDRAGMHVHVVVADGEAESRYAWAFEVVRLTRDRAFLASALFLELGEVITVDLTLKDGTEIRTDIRVVALDAGEIPGMEVEFIGLDETDRKLLEELEPRT